MADFNFPPSPIPNQEHIEGGTVYIWNGYGWAIKISPPPPSEGGTNGLELSYSGMQVNGAFEIAQERGPAGGTTVANSFICDEWKQMYGGTMTINGGIAKNFGGLAAYGFVAITTAQAALADGDYTAMLQQIEGYRTNRLAWGTANAKPATLGFFSANTPAGLYSLVLRNATANRTCIVTYTQNVAGIAEYKTVTVPGDVAGAWEVTNGIGVSVCFTLAAGATSIAPSANVWLDGNFLAIAGCVNGADAVGNALRIGYFTMHPGSQGPTAEQAPLIMRTADQEIITCRRYWQKSYAMGVYAGAVNAPGYDIRLIGPNLGTNWIIGNVALSPVMRAPPAVTIYGNKGGVGCVSDCNTGNDFAALSGAVLTTMERSFSVANQAAPIALSLNGVIFHWTANARFL